MSKDSTCVLLSNGGVKCFGENNQGELGYRWSQWKDPWEEKDPKKKWHEDNFNFGMREGQMGDNLPYVNLGLAHDASLEDRKMPPVGPDQKAKFIAMGPKRSCAILENGMAKCWGDFALHYDAEVRQISTTATVTRRTPGPMGDRLRPLELGK